MKERITQLFQFLEVNRKYNIDFQKRHHEATFSHCKSKGDKIYSLLHSTFYTQSRPKLDKAKIFFKEFYKNRNEIDSFKGFCNYLEVEDTDKPFLDLFKSLKNNDGWGDKTSALLIKNVYQLHYLPELKGLSLWEDVPSLKQEDWLHLPVDVVIMDIFKRFDLSLNTFKKINRYLQKNNFPNTDTWDDLWFWGYFTQNAEDKSQLLRSIGFNEGKYWLELHTPKDSESINDITNKSNQFIELLPK